MLGGNCSFKRGPDCQLGAFGGSRVCEWASGLPVWPPFSIFPLKPQAEVAIRLCMCRNLHIAGKQEDLTLA